jgi:hypothetical protein
MMRLLLLILFFLVPSLALAADLNGKRLLLMCSGADRSQCTGFIAGSVQAQRAWQSAQSVRNAANPDEPAQLSPSSLPPDYCIPKGATNAQTEQFVIKYLNAKPEYMNYDASILVGWALMKAYPCHE